MPRRSHDVLVWRLILKATRWICPYTSLHIAEQWLSPNSRVLFFLRVHWNLGNLLTAFLLLPLLSLLPANPGSAVRFLSYLPIAWGVLRVVEIIRYSAKHIVFDQDQVHADSSDLADAQFALVVLIQSYLEIILWFASFYSTAASSFNVAKLDNDLSSPITSLYFSLVTMSTLGYGDISPITSGATILCGVHAGIGVFMTVIVLGHIIGDLINSKDN